MGGGKLGHFSQSSIYTKLKSAHLPNEASSLSKQNNDHATELKSI